MTQLTTHPNETYAVIVPKDAKDFRIAKYESTSELYYHFQKTGNAFEDAAREGRDIGLGDFTILGTVTSESIDFDVSGIVESRLQYGKYRAYKFYEKDKQAGFTYDKADSFRSLLKSKEVEIGENEKVVIIQKR